MKKVLKFFGYLAALGFVMTFIAVCGAAYIFYDYGRGLPDYTELANYVPPTVTRVYAGDGRLLEEYASENRIYVPIDAMPARLKQAFISAEDKNFYHHPGVDFISVLGAIITNVKNVSKGRRLIGASTITQQVARIFLLTNERSLARKIKEAILSLRIEQAFSKDQILELYLNKIFLGYRSYGVAAAAMNYFNKALDELTVAEVAYLAALPKGPRNYHPIRNHAAALERRNWVIDRMLENGYLTREAAITAWQEELNVRQRAETERIDAPFYAEEVRRKLLDLYGEQGLKEGGMSVHTHLDPKLQAIAERSLRRGLIDYDRRHGWRGAIARLDKAQLASWAEVLEEKVLPKGGRPWQLAVVLSLDSKKAKIGLKGGGQGSIPFAELTWARPWLKGQRVGKKPEEPSDVLKKGDLILVEGLTQNIKGRAYPKGTFGLRQVPDVNGGLVALDPHTGHVLAMTGGFSFEQSQFNRATQAKRQPGSAIKTFIYLAALDAGFTPASIVLDAPFTLNQGPGQGRWKPHNHGGKIHGPSRLRVGLEKSYNLMTVRLANAVGIDKVVDYVKRFGIDDNMQPLLSMALGAGETTLLRMTTAYAQLVNGGKRIKPSIIDRIQNRYGDSIFLQDTRDCAFCQMSEWDGQPPPVLDDNRKQLVDPVSAYQMVSILEGVVTRGTGRRISTIGKPLGGKTGTTNKSRDAWFVGFSPDLAVGAYIGFDNPRTLGRGEEGSSVAAPVFKLFMEEALATAPATPFRVPEQARLVRINSETGLLARPGDDKVILEVFKAGNIPAAPAKAKSPSPPTLSDPALGGQDLLQGGIGLY